jgi:DNA-binding transcriptional LysR family regulator
MDFEQLRILLVLAEEQTFLGAATRLSTSRSRIRRKLDQLEADAQTPLLSREPSGLVLTPAGEALARRGRALLDDAEHLISHVRDVGSEPTGCIKIALSHAPTPVGWDAACSRVLARFPKLRIEFLFSGTPSTLLPGRAEIAFTFEESLPSGCTAFELREVPMRLLASEGYVAAHGVPSEPEELHAHRVAVWRVPGRAVEQLTLRSGRVSTLAPDLISEDPLQLYRMVVAGDCLGYLPELPQLDDPSLKELFVEEIVGGVREQLVVPDILADIPRVVCFVELCQSLPGLSRN